MEPSHLFSRILLVLLISGLESAIAFSSTSGNETDRIALLDFKNHITQDPFRILPSWNDSLHFCHWIGVKCNPTNGRVTILNLESQNLFGSIPPSVGNLTFLTGINLKDNNFQGEIPQEIGRLIRLQHLNLSYNSFSGKISSNISQCRELTIFDVRKNRLVGQIPEQLGSLSKLVYLAVDINNLSGIIPAYIGNLSSLYHLSLMQNSLKGTIPEEIGLLSGLGFFQVSQNGISGPISVSLSNASGLMLVDFAQNSLTGTLPRSLGTLQGMNHFNFDDNKLGSGKIGGLNFLEYMANWTSLEVLGLGRNQFGGKLPNSIANLSTTLQRLSLGSNMLYGSVPNGVGNLVNLTSLGLEGNYLNGSIPDGVETLRHLVVLNLNVNRFSGLIPSSLGNLTSLTRLFMEENRLEGSIPPSLGSCSKLQVMNLSSNKLSGPIPKEIIGLSSLSISLVLSNNSFTGSLPFEVGNLFNVMELDLSNNKLSGEIPSSLSRCISLERLNLGCNFLQGTIPESLKALRGLGELDFSRNNLSGHIPEFLGKLLLLKKLDLSFNSLEGQVPIEGIFGNFSAISIVGNNKICGGISDLHLPLCSQVDKKSSRKFLAPSVVIPVTTCVILGILLCSLAACYVIRKSNKKSLAAFSTQDWQRGISYMELAMSTNGFSEENLIGTGSFGSVYKGILFGDGAVVSVKVLNLEKQGASKSFMDECNALRNIRHRNLLKIITTCSSVDQHGNDFKALVLEFMCNGSLEQWLHPGPNEENEANKSLKFIQRLNIAVDVASALEYLHHHCEIPIVHCDLKPSNVLLDYDMTAHVGDFGLARFLIQAANDLSNEQNLSVGLKGSIGYIAPENGMGAQVSTLGDVYSYGILLLEMFTGKRPTDDIFNDGLSICDFVSMGLLERVREIVDRSLLLEEEEEEGDHGNKDGIMEERAIINDGDPQSSNARSGMVLDCTVSVLRLGLSCSDSLPSERIPMNIVANKMHAIRDSFIRFQKRNRK
ncbi:putative receptor-like protein kinase At3g47110 isoform X2 [Rhododendron vialii]|uniref:putative receptor-like protein kinase At3g47110 isoform X2 n=1 Tax=Rhododendron vialii TaxID=182163 RepID=UPI00265F77F6|nr:putative receptor-like protein kinase At3g47110 isoform X2 [Rhododendron vialii]